MFLLKLMIRDVITLNILCILIKSKGGVTQTEAVPKLMMESLQRSKSEDSSSLLMKAPAVWVPPWKG